MGDWGSSGVPNYPGFGGKTDRLLALLSADSGVISISANLKSM
jgi:hypothetical protein